jgi:exodeoxyribonuclease V gamma subunit
LLRPHAAYLQDGLGLRLPEEEPPLPEHEPLGAPDALEAWALRHAVFAAWLREGGPPRVDDLHADLLARALVAPGADGRATVAAVLDDVAPFAALARAHGYGPGGARVAVNGRAGGHVVRGTLDGVQDGRVLRVVFNAGGVQGHHAVRHRLDALAARLHGLTVDELAVPAKGELPMLTPLPAPAVETAAAVLASLAALRATALRTPLVFLPKSAYAYVQDLGDGVDAAMKSARATWMGSDWQAERAEATPATRIALRGRDPFYDEDDEARARFQALAVAVHAALHDHVPLDIEALA